MSQAPPSIAYLLPTGRCNLACTGCYATLEQGGRHTAIGELDLARYRAAVDELVRMGVSIFDISGGEPFLYPHLVPLCEAIRAHAGTRIWLVTNGTRARAGQLEQLAGMVERLVFSLDAPEPQLHDRLRGRSGAFETTLKTLRAARTLGFAELGVNQLLVKENAASVPDMLALCRREQVDRLVLLTFRDVSENGVMTSSLPALPLLQEIWRTVVATLEAQEFPRQVDVALPAFLYPEARVFQQQLSPELRRRFSFHYTHLRGLSAFRQSIVLKPQGGVTGDTAMANFPDFEIGSVSEGLSLLWEQQAPVWRERLLERERRLRSEGPCQHCPRWHVCRGGCPAAALHQWGKEWRHDRTCDTFRAAGGF